MGNRVRTQWTRLGQGLTQRFAWRWRLSQTGMWVFLFLLGVGVLAASLWWTGPGEQALFLQAGDVAPRDILAPYALTYESQVLTEQRRQAAAAGVRPVYTAPDVQVGRRQMERLRAALDFIAQVRADVWATPEQKRADLQALEGMSLTTEQMRYLLALSDTQWEDVRAEAERVLEQVMRNTVREDQIDQIRNTIPALIRLDLSPEQAELVAALVSAYVAPNSLYSPELTAAAQEQARSAVAPVTRSFRQGETIVQRGQVLTDADIEALAQYGLLQSRTPWQLWLAPLLWLGVWVVAGLGYLYRRPALRANLPGLTWLVLGLALGVAAVRVATVGHTVLPYLAPVPLYILLTALLLGLEPAAWFGLAFVALAFYGYPRSTELLLYHWLGGVTAALLVGRGTRVGAFARAALGSSLALGGVLGVFRLGSPETDWNGLLTLLVAAALNAGGSTLGALALHYLLGPWLGQVPPLRLLDLARPDHPLLRYLLRRAPGTYQHSLQVANLAEQAAERIGADPLLIRVGALYHDVGKAENPHFFVENLPPGVPSPHRDLSPEESSAIIRRHVTDGLALARKYHLPARLRDFIAEHHGTTLTRYQYALALEAAGGDASRVDESRFRYPGPRPRSKETAILMLADGVEALVRAEAPTEEAQLRALVRRVWQQRLAEGQLDEAPLTLRDLGRIEDAFVEALKGIYHPRLRYPEVPAQGSAQESLPLPQENTLLENKS